MDRLRASWLWGIVTIPWGLVSVSLTAVAIFAALPFVGAQRAFFGIGKLWVRQELWVSGGTWSVAGWEELPEEIRTRRQPAIFMSNHESLLDPPFLMGAIPIPAVFIAKKELRWVPFIGWAAWAAGVIFIDRSNRERALHSIRQAAREIRQGKSVVIFPEGTRTRTGELGPFKNGGFGLALDAGVPIVPLATVGGLRVLPAGALRPRPGTYRVAFGSPVHPSDYADRDALRNEVRHRIEALMQRLA